MHVFKVVKPTIADILWRALICLGVALLFNIISITTVTDELFDYTRVPSS
jgi:hypothetical protein